MWTDSRNLALYDGDRCAGHPPCQRWLDRVRERLPAGTGQAAVSATDLGQVTVKLTWQAPSEEVRQFETTTAVNPNLAL
jgi:hypothetical protein